MDRSPTENDLLKQSFYTISPKTQACLTSLVVEPLLAVLPVEDLKRCRRVCTVWEAEGFRVLRKKAYVKLDTKSRQNQFLRWPARSKFSKFAFSIGNWNEEICDYLRTVQPCSLETRVDLMVKHEQDGRAVELLDNLIRTFSNTLTRLVVNVDWAGTIPFVVPDSLLLAHFSQLKEFTFNNSQIEATWFDPLWIAVVKNAPKLVKLNMRNISSKELWLGMVRVETFSKLIDLQYKSVTRHDLPQVHGYVINGPYPMSYLRRLSIPFSDPLIPELERLLRRFSRTLEILEFTTIDDTVLSPIIFPVMNTLVTLDAGSSQFSFPSLTSEALPKLREIWATYWDWVVTTEQVPDIHYYWRTDNPHAGVKNVHLRLPSWYLREINYRRMENFSDFASAIRAKFPNACNFIFYNVPLRDDAKRELEMFFAIVHDSVKSFRIGSYCMGELAEATPFELYMRADEPAGHRVLEELDLGTEQWPEIWKRDPALFSTIRGEEWIPNLLLFPQLRVIKLLWARNLLSLLRLTDPNVLPNLEHLEFVGDKCVDRFVRAAVKQSRPNLKLVQNRNCQCIEEDWWYITDPESDKVFQRMFFYRPNSGISNILRNVGERILNS